jgi:hypothetical protein
MAPLVPTSAHTEFDQTGHLLTSIVASDPPYDAVDDLCRGFYYATWTNETSTLTSAYTFQGSITVRNTGPNGVAQLTLPGALNSSGLGDPEDWVGLPIAITGAGPAGNVLVTRVTAFNYLPRNDHITSVWTLGVAAPTPLVTSHQKLACPCFTTGSDGSGFPSCVAKYLWCSDATLPCGYLNSVSGNFPLLDTIASVNSPFSVTVEHLTFNTGDVADKPGVRIRWFTNNAPSIIKAWAANAGRGRRNLLFAGHRKPNRTGIFGVIGYPNLGLPSDADYDLSRAMGSMDWWTSGRDVETEIVSNANETCSYFLDNQYPRQAIPIDAPNMPAMPDECGGRFPCSQTLTHVPVVVVGDSFWVEQPSGNGNNLVSALKRWLDRRNGQRTIDIINRSAAATEWRSLACTGSLGSGYPWDNGGNWLDQVLAIPDRSGAGTIRPALIALAFGVNDAQVLHPNDVWAVLHQIMATQAYNGLPPDILLHCEGIRGAELWLASAEEYSLLGQEYATGYIRSVARANGFPLVDWGTAAMLAQYGWSPTHLLRRVVPPLLPGIASAISPYQFPRGYLCRDFRIVLKLGTGAGDAFWSAIDTLELALSPKPDNRLVLSTARAITGSDSGSLYAYVRAWGGVISTPTSLHQGSAELTTSGQANLPSSGPAPVIPTPPIFGLANLGPVLSADVVGQCYFTPGVGYRGQDFRTIITGFVGEQLITGSDANDHADVGASTHYVGGWMFKFQDAQAKADVRIVDSAGNTLVTTITEYMGFQRVRLATEWPHTSLVGNRTALEVGRFSAPSRMIETMRSGSPQPVGADSHPGGQYLAVEKCGTRVRVSVVLGADFNADVLQACKMEQTIFDSDVECFGGPFIPQIWTTGGTATIAPVWVEIDDPRGNYTRPTMTSREFWGTAELTSAYPLGGDAAHPSRAGIRRTLEAAYAASNLSFGPFPAGTASLSASTGFAYTIPANQAFTALTLARPLESGTITLPREFPQGTPLELFSSQGIASLTIHVPSGLGLIGTPVAAIAANQTIGFRLQGRSFHRVR